LHANTDTPYQNALRQAHPSWPCCFAWSFVCDGGPCFFCALQFFLYHMICLLSYSILVFKYK
jgi:hypothetical protein